MALPNNLHDAICTEYDPLSGLPLPAPPFTVPLKDLGIHFPGGTFLQAVGAKIHDVPKLLLAQLNTALLPLVPLFDIIDVVLALKALFDAITSLDPYEIARALEKWLKKLDKLKELIPQVAIPRTILDTIDALIAFLLIMRAELQVILDTRTKLDLAESRAHDLGDPAALLEAIACGRTNLDAAFAQIKNGAAPLNRLIGILNIVGGLAGLGELPTLDGVGADASSMLGPVDTLIAALKTARAAIPV